MRLWIAAGYMVSAACVWWDAHRLGMTYGGPGGRDGSLGAPGWALLTLVMAPVAIPLYLWRRRRWLPAAGRRPPDFGGPTGSATVAKDGREWPVGTGADVAWIQRATTVGVTITSAIPPAFAAFATVVVPDKGDGRSEHVSTLLRLLREQTPDQPWWLGYLDTGADDVVFPDALPVTLYSGWRYALVLAGPEQAATWRRDPQSWRAPGPDLIFPADRTWLVSWLWDDDWRCLGGPASLVQRILDDPQLDARRVGLDQDATPPGHLAR